VIAHFFCDVRYLLWGDFWFWPVLSDAMQRNPGREPTRCGRFEPRRIVDALLRAKCCLGNVVGRSRVSDTGWGVWELQVCGRNSSSDEINQLQNTHLFGPEVRY
jgi:hypothetical protein